MMVMAMMLDCFKPIEWHGHKTTNTHTHTDRQLYQSHVRARWSKSEKSERHNEREDDSDCSLCNTTATSTTRRWSTNENTDIADVSLLSTHNVMNCTPKTLLTSLGHVHNHHSHSIVFLWSSSRCHEHQQPYLFQLIVFQVSKLIGNQIKFENSARKHGRAKGEARITRTAFPLSLLLALLHLNLKTRTA